MSQKRVRIQGRGKAIRRGNRITHVKQPLIIGVGGSHSGCGKTAVAEVLLKHLSTKIQKSRSSEKKDFCASALPNFRTDALSGHGWGAIKYTKTALYASVIDDIGVLAQQGKDTQRLLKAGAGEVLWVQSPPEELKEVLPLALGRFSDLKGIIIEGNSAIEFLKPDIVIFILGTDGEPSKGSALRVLNMADIILFETEPSVKLPEKARKFNISLSSMSGIDKCMEYINRLLG